MVQHLIVPIDGSDASWHAADVAIALARRCDTNVDIIEMVTDRAGVADAERDSPSVSASTTPPVSR